MPLDQTDLTERRSFCIYEIYSFIANTTTATLSSAFCCCSAFAPSLFPNTNWCSTSHLGQTSPHHPRQCPNKNMFRTLVLLLITFSFSLIPSTLAFLPAAADPPRSTNMSRSSTISAEALVDPIQRDAHYGGNVAQYLIDLHDTKSTFNFCGGMMFQLVLSDALRDHLGKVAANGGDSPEQPTIAPSSQGLMSALPNYEQSAAADNMQTFHGREVRKVKDAAGGMGFALHLSLANGNDPEGWTAQEIAGYDGWKHDVSRQWRTGDVLEQEGFTTFKNKFGPDAFTLHHKCYLHYDGFNKMWLSAEDGCEGTPSGDGSMMGKLLGMIGL